MRVALVVKLGEEVGPVRAGDLRTDEVVPHSNFPAQPVQQARRWGCFEG